MNVLKSYEKLFRSVLHGYRVTLAQKALFKGLKYIGEENDRRLMAESDTIDLQIAMAEQAIRLYSKFPPSDPEFEGERKFWIERYQALLPALQTRKKAKVEEQNKLKEDYLKVTTEVTRKFPGIDTGG